MGNVVSDLDSIVKSATDIFKTVDEAIKGIQQMITSMDAKQMIKQSEYFSVSRLEMYLHAKKKQSILLGESKLGADSLSATISDLENKCIAVCGTDFASLAGQPSPVPPVARNISYNGEPDWKLALTNISQMVQNMSMDPKMMSNDILSRLQTSFNDQSVGHVASGMHYFVSGSDYYWQLEVVVAPGVGSGKFLIFAFCACVITPFKK